MQSFLVTFFIAYLLYCFFSYLFHSLQKTPIIREFKFKPIYLFSPSYFFAKHFKQNLSKNEKTCLLKFWNIGNLIISIIFFIFLFFLEMSNSTTSPINLKPFSLFIFTLWLIRCISRSLEIIVAFFKDITTKESSSTLTKSDRIKLATISYLEVIFNFGILYFILYILSSNIKVNSLYLNLLISDIKNLILLGTSYTLDENILTSINNYYPANIFYFTFSSFFISTGTRVVGINPLFILQLSTSLSLVVFAIAGYISDIKNPSE